MAEQRLDLPKPLLADETKAREAAGRKRTGRVGLAFSGGGIRSACFNLGILQALDERGLFGRIDYLSTVSGGGYLGSWLVSCLRENPDFKPSREGKEIGLFYLLNELVGTANSSDNYIYLSDGGHFENLGVYELIRRRCKWIIVGDGEQDGNYVFESLGGLVRKCWTDLGVRVDVQASNIKKAPDAEYNPAQFVLGTITYRGEEEPKTGTILYLKSSLSGKEPADVLQYHYQHKDFPHETTADQFFSESQFESYRKLGYFIADTALRDKPVREIMDAENTHNA